MMRVKLMIMIMIVMIMVSARSCEPLMQNMFWLFVYGVHSGATWTEQSVCGGDAALRQITLTTCLNVFLHLWHTRRKLLDGSSLWPVHF